MVVSVVHIAKSRGVPNRKRLDGRSVSTITAFLFHAGEHDDPSRLKTNAGLSFQGSIVLGMGFTFDDTKDVSTPLAEMERLIQEDTNNRDVIYPYIGGQEVNASPTSEPHRYVINFWDYPLQREDLARATQKGSGESGPKDWLGEGIASVDYSGPVAADWPDLLLIVTQKVKPERMALKRKDGKIRWWQFVRPKTEFYTGITDLDRVVAISAVGQHCAFTFLPTDMVYSHALIIFPLDTHAAFCALQSRPHELWARFFGSSMKDDLRYTPSDVFETFPFPRDWTTDPTLETAGEAYYEFRADLMVMNNEGLTKTYNRFHDPDERNPDIAELRTLHAAMDRAVMHAYGWTDIPTDCEFLPEHEDDDDEGSSRRKKRYRYRWPNPVHDEVLGRLMELNAERAEEERRAASEEVRKR